MAIAKLEPMTKFDLGTKMVPWKERRAEGKALRRAVPPEAHAEWKPRKNRPDPLKLLAISNKGRQADLVPLRMGRMAASPFAFLRGSACVMAADLSISPISGIPVVMDGDAHINNFGMYGTPQREVVFDLNDFDEATIGPWEWDLKRLVASVNVAGRQNGLNRRERAAAVKRGVEGYRFNANRLESMGVLDVWYLHAYPGRDKPIEFREDIMTNTNKRTVLIAAALLAAVVPAIAQTGGGPVAEKLAAVKQSVAANQQKLHQYQWKETTQLTLKGDPKPPSQSACQYGPDGKVQKTPLTSPPPPPSGGRMKQRVIANKKAEMKDYMGDVKVLLAKYVPPNPQSMQQTFQSGKVSLSPDASSGVAQIVFKDYALPGDQMTISFDTAAKKISSVNVNTYLDNPKDVVTLAVQFSSLPDGTNYVQQTVLNATAKNLVVTTTNSDYTPLGAQ